MWDLVGLFDVGDEFVVIDLSNGVALLFMYLFLVALIECNGLLVWVKLGWIDVVCFAVHGILVVNFGLGDVMFVYICDELVVRELVECMYVVLVDLVVIGV